MDRGIWQKNICFCAIFVFYQGPLPWFWHPGKIFWVFILEKGGRLTTCYLTSGQTLNLFQIWLKINIGSALISEEIWGFKDISWPRSYKRFQAEPRQHLLYPHYLFALHNVWLSPLVRPRQWLSLIGYLGHLCCCLRHKSDWRRWRQWLLTCEFTF